MKLLTLIILLVLISACSKLDKDQAFNNCHFDAVKNGHDGIDSRFYTASCMRANGYSIILGDEGCGELSGLTPTCWKYTWRVFLF